MTATFTIAGQPWPDGTSVSVYLAAAQPDPGQQPSGPAIATGIVVSGAVTFTGLAEQVRYVAWAAGVGRRFLVPTQTGSASVADRARLDSLELQRVKYSDLPVLGKHYALPTGGDDTAALVSAIADANGRGGDVIELRGGTHTVSAVNLAGKDRVRLKGAGRETTTLVLTSATGNVIDLTGASRCEISDMLIRSSVQRTAGAGIYVDAGAGSCIMNSFRRLWLSSLYKGIQLNNCATVVIDEVQFGDFNASWSWDSLIHLSGQATGITLDRLSGGTAAGVVNAAVYISGAAVDTVHGSNWDLIGLSGANMRGLKITAGEWIHLDRISLESAGEHAVLITDGKGINLHNVHLLGYRGVELQGGKGVTIDGGDILSCQQEGVYLVAFATLKDTKILNLDVSDTGLATNNTYNAIYVTNNVNDFTIANCRAGGNALLGSTNRAKNGCQIDATNDRYVIVGNRFTGATGGLLDNGGGATKAVTGNINA